LGINVKDKIVIAKYIILGNHHDAWILWCCGSQQWNNITSRGLASQGISYVSLWVPHLRNLCWRVVPLVELFLLCASC
jgi:hypothetical protein